MLTKLLKFQPKYIYNNYKELNTILIYFSSIDSWKTRGQIKFQASYCFLVSGRLRGTLTVKIDSEGIESADNFDSIIFVSSESFVTLHTKAVTIS
jgi:hypothetical protein